MAHYRSEYRRLVREALAAHPRFAGFTIMKVWPGSVDDETLPVIGVLTPQEPSARDTQKTVTRRTLLQIAVRRIGDEEIEDTLDDDSAEIEAAVLAALRNPEHRCVLEDTSVISHTSSRKNVGTLVMSFRVQSWRSEPSLP
ncbi:hypothetical protein JJJ17_09365 [Paracoccus caeni]|uniref:Uncharacterized protein n=1 Tax=Paracoccus caeni TaxID=657651 RepID=A0A934SKL9_9RHOB|nr:hypothetical protein [Paracoccus caeni]MBK4216133.1 hypothetical protein [Paracoccus caeni]